MQINFKDISYLKTGNLKQQNAYKTLIELDIFNTLKDFNPILVGTIPIQIDIDKSDLDIVCEVYDFVEFEELIVKSFNTFKDFKFYTTQSNCKKVFVANFMCGDFEIELYATSLSTVFHNGYRHMLIEHRLLNLYGSEFKNDIIALKKEGLKTEPSFAKLLNLNGDPYEELLKLDSLTDSELIDLYRK